MPRNEKEQNQSHGKRETKLPHSQRRRPRSLRASEILKIDTRPPFKQSHGLCHVDRYVSMSRTVRRGASPCDPPPFTGGIRLRRNIWWAVSSFRLDVTGVGLFHRPGREWGHSLPGFENKPHSPPVGLIYFNPCRLNSAMTAASTTRRISPFRDTTSKYRDLPGLDGGPTWVRHRHCKRRILKSSGSRDRPA